GGLLLPQIESADTLSDELKKPGMLVYNKTDGKVYTYNGAAWSAGSGGGDPGPALSSCNGSVSVTGGSGYVYRISSYPLATNGLQNLCWTIENLREEGYSLAKFADNPGGGGHFYTLNGGAVCATKLGSDWRTPTKSDWDYLFAFYPDMTIVDKWYWSGPPAVGGFAIWAYKNSSDYRWILSPMNKDGWWVYAAGSGTFPTIKLSDDVGWATIPRDCIAGYDCSQSTPYAHLRCVRDL
ncbi:MAG: hypothetical protein LBN93_10305, partial [Candidatus Symbiothrix sp.]|nr:hypothetical protein [Candidatus Symbiothrix sp.]